MATHGAARLTGVTTDLIRLVLDVGAKRDIAVVQGARTIEEEQTDIDRGVSRLKDPRHSLHVIIPGERPFALAVDLAPWPINWADKQSFIELGAFMKQRAAALGIEPFSWGGDWPHAFDFDHFQKAPAPQ